MTKMNCEQCEDLLFDFHEGRLPAGLAADVDTHLQSCSGCGALLNDIWQMSLVASRWQDQTPGSYDRGRHDQSGHDRGGKAEVKSRSWRFPEVLATAVSILAMILVLTDARIDTSDGLALRFGSGHYVTEDNFSQLQAAVAGGWQQRLDDLSARQAAGDQLVLRSVLRASREERREALAALADYWDSAQAQQYRETEEHLRYLLASQAEDEKDIRQLSNAFHQVSVRRGNNM